ncbi:hypothetical protein CLTEP_25020 [Clostridium tepidiprofundi DSM 19306]|uniref:Uncharacterized protein n=1 Tax=Clostridium tepidiprofundi DSM 19306 TaxID=1121338 RepID=A0A151ASY3_9CLOT|nr:hypothetical protein [Clostridium tepidiprofundi]KYH30736.1 hypothetical protein CLTEP_25020 [Clostridium tepidiprofundi DSM 19306]
MKENIQSLVRRVGEKYQQSPKELRIFIGKVLEGTIKLSSDKKIK